MSDSSFGAKWIKAVQELWETSTSEWLKSIFEDPVDEEGLRKLTGGEMKEEITFCGLQMRWYEEGLRIHQQKYIQSILKKTGLESCNTAATILPVNAFHDDGDEESPM